MFLVLGQNVLADFIIRYEDGSHEISKYDPRLSDSLSLLSKSVSYIEEDRILYKHALESRDPLVFDQWIFNNYINDSFSKSKALESEMDRVSVAVIDTGILNHEDLINVMPGADFISDVENSRDGDGRDEDPEDLGDYGPSSCKTSNSNSSWHGTHIAGIVGSTSHNDVGIRGINDQVNIVPIRVLGPCGGKTSDIADAIRWSVGGQVEGLSQNSNPVKVVNLSLGGRGSCSNYLQEAIDFATDQGALVVVSAGNEASSIDSAEFTPVNCKGVFKVGSIHSSLTQSNFTNYGKKIDVYAPGDNIYSTFNSGYSTSSYDDYAFLSGTSMSAAVVSSIAAGVMGLNSNLTLDQVKNIMASSGELIDCFYGDCEGKLALDPLRAYQKALVTLGDPSYSYDDNDVEGGVETINSNDTNFTTNSDGGKCGTIIRKSDRQSFYRLMSSFTIILMAFLLINSMLALRMKD